MILFDKIKSWYDNRPCDSIIAPNHHYEHTDGGVKMRGTGTFINGKPIESKYSINIATCIKCGDVVKTEWKEMY